MKRNSAGWSSMPRKDLVIDRRIALKLVSGSFVLGSLGTKAAFGATPQAETVGDKTASDGMLALAFDDSLRTKVSFRGKALTPYQKSESLVIGDGSTVNGTVDAFAFASHTVADLQHAMHGAARRHTIIGKSK